MPLKPFLKGRIFDPEAITAMTEVFVDLCDRLGLKDKADSATQLVAEKVIELAGTGAYDEDGLRAAALRAFDLRDCKTGGTRPDAARSSRCK